MSRVLCFVVFLPAILSRPVLADEKESAAPTEQQLAFVRTKVLPLLEARCFKCHKNGGDFKGGLFLGNRSGMLKGGDSGPAVVPGKPDDSLLIQAVRYESFEMPPRSQLPKQEVDILVRWVREGAIWPSDMEAAPAEAPADFPLEERKRSHWAWQPIQDPPAPIVNHKDWGRDPLDTFVAARLEQNKLSPAPDADRYTLIRRLYFDVIGLPPTTDEIKAFVSDPRDDDAVMQDTVDSLLKSPHFGERWGRHWLDLVRYAETLGHEFDYPLHHAWRYRDYVIRAFNEDVPYDQFVKEHVAGDLLPAPRRHPTELYNESIIGTGFWFLSEDKHAPVDVKGEEASKIDNQIDVFSKTFLGLTVACARCHDHKFDAISTKDYYALAGFLQSSRRQTAWLDPGRKIEAVIERMRQLRQQTRREIAATTSQQSFRDQLEHLVAAALECVHGTPSADEQASEDLKRNIDGVAARYNVAPPVLKTVISVLRTKRNALRDNILSLPASLIQASTANQDAVAGWQRKVTQPASPDETTLFADFSNGLPNGWFATGHAFQNIKPASAPDLEWRRDTIVHNFRQGLSSATLSKELRGTLASPTFELQHPEILVRVAGENTRMRLIIDGYVMFEYNGLLFGGVKQDIKTEGEFRWLRFAGDTHRYQGHRMYIEFLDEGNGWFNVSEIRFADRPGARPPARPPAAALNTKLQSLLTERADTKDAIALWAQQVCSDDELAAAVAVNLQLARPESQNQWASAASSLPAPVPVIAMTEGTPEDEHVFIRGNHRNAGEVVPRHLLTALRPSDEPPVTQGSGRLRLAEQLVSHDNPLVTRVAVNRIWHHLFGRGIVETPDNFGVLGKTPTHPQLLDHLATRFRRNGWSWKRMIREILLSRTYRMSSHRESAAETRDPENRLFHRFNIRRLQGEAVRDAILAVSGRLNKTMFGPPVPVHLTPFMQGRGRPGQNGPIDGNGRRSIYIAVRRNFLSPFMLAFDVPPPVTTIGRRTVSNVPAQALIMLNNEFVQQQARVWAERLLQEGHANNENLLSTAWFQLFGRPPAQGELSPLLAFAGAEKDGPLMSADTLADVCHVMLNSKEFIFLR